MTSRLALAMTALAALSACAGKTVKLPLNMGTLGAEPSGDMSEAVALLEKGDWKSARKELRVVLKQRPGNGTATKLLRQIDADPKALLGKASFAYRARPGDTFQALAQRYLGDRLMFYALARYNGVTVPAQLAAGSNLRIPGAERVAPKPAIVRPAAIAPKPAGANAASPALAAALRRQGLSALAKGDPNRAVGLLGRAAQADPGNKVIAADLARARRVQAAVR